MISQKIEMTKEVKTWLVKILRRQLKLRHDKLKLRDGKLISRHEESKL